MKRSPMPPRTAPLARSPLKSKSATTKGKRVKLVARCSWSNRCKRRPSVTVSEDERYCKTHAAWIAGKLVGDFVKARDGACVSCGATDDLEWAHIHSRGMVYIKFDPGNAVALCRGCHYRYTVQPAAWSKFVERTWPGLWAELIHREFLGEASGKSVDLASIIVEFREEAAA